MSKKVGIITFHAAYNCGSIMQAYSLQQAIRKLGYETEILDFSSEGQKNMYSVFAKNDSLKHIIKNILLLPYTNRIKSINQDYEQFIKKNLTVTQEKYSRVEEMLDLEDKFDAFVSGSDQIWNVTIPDYDMAYFLPFVQKKKKIAYAVSFGAKNINKYSKDLEAHKKYINEYDFLSTRENNGKKWLQEITDKVIDVVLDPTLIVDPEEIFKLEKDPEIEGEYIFYYAPKYYKDANEVVYNVSKKYNLPVVMWNAKEWVISGLKNKKFQITKHQDPGVYLSLIKNAKLVFTTSFHGTIFSTIYKKNFWILKRGGMNGDDDRVKTLVEQMNLSHRFLEPNNYDMKTILEPIDYLNLSQTIEKRKQDSIKFLKNALEN